MQLTNPPALALFPAVEKVLQAERLARYMPAAGGNKALAFAYYLWNCDLSQAFYTPLHFAEIACRNAVHSALLFRLGDNWFDDPTFKKILDHRFSSELANAVADERGQHGNNLTAHHVVSALTFGFWEHLTTKRFERLLWSRGIRHNFPGAHFQDTRDDLHGLIESVRRWRNRIAHHRAIFDKSPSRKFHDVMLLIEWACPDTAAWVTSEAQVQTAINSRPAA